MGKFFHDIAERFVVLDRGSVAMQKTKNEIPKAIDLINAMEVLAHVGKKAMEEAAP